jgi:glutamate-5-semialdehyde dehydrogenase
MEGAVRPALAEAGLPPGAMSLVDSAERSAGWALFADRRLALAVARGSGPAVAQLGAIARQTGTPVSLHGTGGAWMIADASADPDRFREVVFHSLDRKVCNTLNVCVIVRPRAADLVPDFLAALEAAGRRRRGFRLHVLEGAQGFLPGGDWMHSPVEVVRPEGPAVEPRADILAEPDLAREWEWEETPEVTLAVVDDLDAAIGLFNRWAPRLVATLVAEDPAALVRFEAGIEAPFTGDGFTRWVDGQYALNRPELGLSNWEGGRLFARGGVLGGDGVFTIRTRMRQVDTGLDRSGSAASSGSLRARPEA